MLKKPAAPRHAISGGRVLKSVGVGSGPRVLRSPERERKAAAAERLEKRAEAASHSREGSGEGAREEYEKGFREGIGAAEAALREATESAVRGARQGAYEKGRQEGRDEGLKDGRMAGRAEMERDLRESREALSSRLKQVDALLAGFAAEVERRLAASEHEVVALVHASVCRILGAELVKPDGVAACVSQALCGVKAGGLEGGVGEPMTVLLNPKDLELMQRDGVLAGWMRQVEAVPVGVRWVEDRQIERGGCVVRSVDGSLDARLERQMAALQQILKEGASPKQGADCGSESPHEDAKPEPGVRA